jgi:pimeloyl-ACP methyl ester carboxylesterase
MTKKAVLMNLRLSLFATAGALALAACSTPPASQQPVARVVPATDCTAWVGTDRSAELPGYLLPQANGKTQCVPLLVTANKPPAGYAGDYYTAEFTDAKLKERWASCKADAACHKRIDDQMQRWLPPNKERATRVTGMVDPVGKIDSDSAGVDLRAIRKPGFFGKAPYREAVAEADARTNVVEFTAPRDPLERLKLNMPGDIKLRGWYVEGTGVDDGRGGRTRALVVMSPGGGGQLTAIQHPDDKPITFDAATRKVTNVRFPNATTEGMGMRTWRDHLHALNRAGFDVLAYDRRGEGLSGGFSDTNTLEQSEDIYRVLDQMEHGRGMRMLTPQGAVLEGPAAGGKLMAGMKARQIPLLLLGYSRGSMATGWFLQKNYAQGCSYDLPTVTCTPARGFTNIKGAMLYASFVSGAGYLPQARDLADRNLFLGGMAADNRVAFYPNSAVLASMDRWPAVFFAKGLWDRAESLEGTIAAYDRVRGLKEIVVVRGPHSMEAWPEQEIERAKERMVQFAVAAVQGRTALSGAKPWSNIKELVATTPDVWEPSSAPR